MVRRNGNYVCVSCYLHQSSDGLTSEARALRQRRLSGVAPMVTPAVVPRRAHVPVRKVTKKESKKLAKVAVGVGLREPVVKPEPMMKEAPRVVVVGEPILDDSDEFSF